MSKARKLANSTESVVRSTTLNQTAVTQGESTQSGFSAAIYTGDGSSSHAINTGLDMDTGDFGGLVWIKNRDGTNNHRIMDTVRGNLQYLVSDTTNSEITNATTTLESFDNDGFTVGTSGSANANADKFASWSWQTTKKVTGTTNRNKAYTCHYNPDLGFSIVGYEGDGEDGHEIPYHLGVKSEWSISKDREGDGSEHWVVHSPLFPNQYLRLNGTDALNTTTNLTALFSKETLQIGSHSWINAATENYISYHFASVPNVSKIGKYIGIGAAGNYVDCGFKPAWVIIKNMTSTSDWYIWDSTRGDTSDLYANSANAETYIAIKEFTDNGFVLKDAHGTVNSLNNEYLFMAYAESSTGGASTNTYTNSDYTYPTTADTLSIAQNTLISFAQGFDANGQVDSKENVGSGVTYALGAGHENKHYYIYKDLGGSYGVTENRPLEGITRNDADKWGEVSPLDASLRTTAKHFDYESSTGVVSASGERGAGYEAYKAFNKDSNDIVGVTGVEWYATTSTLSWLQYKGVEPRIIKSWRLREGSDVDRVPKRFTIEGSHNGFSWTAIDSTYTANDYLGNGVYLWGDINLTGSNTTAYLYHRINITNNSGDSTYTAITELEFNTILPSDYYLIDAGKMYNSSGTAINRTYLAEFRTDSDGDVINSTLANMPVAKQRFNDVEAHGDLTVHGEIKNIGVATAWVNFDGTQNPPLIRDSYNVSDVVDLGTGNYKIVFDTPMDSFGYAYTLAATGYDNRALSHDKNSVKVKIYNQGQAGNDYDLVCLSVFGGKS